MIRFKPYGKTYSKGFSVMGHANYAEHGQDIVCASVSATTQMVAMHISKLDIGRVLQSSDELYCIIDNYAELEAQPYTDMLLSFMRELQKQYPDYIIVDEENDEYDERF